MVPQVDFDIVSSILKVLKGWELGNEGLYTKYLSYKKIIKKSKFYFGPRSPKKRCLRFFRICLRKNGPEIWESRVKRLGTCSSSVRCVTELRYVEVFWLPNYVKRGGPQPGRLTRDSQISGPFFRKKIPEKS